MTGVIKLYLKNRLVNTVPFYSKENCKRIYNKWRDMYLYGVIHVLPDYVAPKEPKPKKVIKKVVLPPAEILMTDFISDKATGLKHETYYHRMYHKGEK